jgi:hypothetical protein
MKKKGFFDDRDPFSGKGEGEGEKMGRRED